MQQLLTRVAVRVDLPPKLPPAGFTVTHQGIRHTFYEPWELIRFCLREGL